MKKLKLILLTAISIVLINSCGGSPYKIGHYADKFNNDGKDLISTRENYLRINPLGDDLLNIISKLDAGIIVNRAKNCIKDTSLYLYQTEGYSTGYLTGSRNATWLHIVRGSRLIFLADGKRIAFAAASAKQRTRDDGYNSISKEATMLYIDEAIYPVTLKKFKQVAFANHLEVRVEGINHNRDYDDNIINENLAKNFKKFYQEEIATRKMCR